MYSHRARTADTKGRKEVICSFTRNGNFIDQLLLVGRTSFQRGSHSLLCCDLRRPKGKVRWRQPNFNICDLCGEACHFPLPWVRGGGSTVWLSSCLPRTPAGGASEIAAIRHFDRIAAIADSLFIKHPERSTPHKTSVPHFL